MTTSSDILQGLSSSIFDNEAKFARERSFGKKLLITAWAVEIMAASIGLIIAFTMAYDAYNNAEVKNVNTTINALLGALPFLLIAIIEPTKIPLASGLYKVKNWGWKTLILIALLGLTGVTFETLFTGLERQVTNVTAEISRGENKIYNIEEDNLEIGRLINDYSNIDIDQETTDLSIQINKNKELEAADLLAATNDYDTSKNFLNEELTQLTAEIIRLENQRTAENQKTIDALDSTIIALNEQLQAKVTERETEKANLLQLQQGGSLDEIIQRYETEIGTIEASIQEATSLLNSNESPQIQRVQRLIGVIDDGKAGNNTRRNFDAWRQNQLEKIADINQKIQTRLSELDQNSSARESIIEENISKLSKEIDELQKDRSLAQQRKETVELSLAKPVAPSSTEILLREQLELKNLEISKLNENYNKKIERIRADRQTLQKNYEEQKVQIEAELTALKNSVPLLKKELGENIDLINENSQELRIVAQKNQIYRFAQKLNGYDDILDVTEKDLTFVATIWFGSIALVCATVGTILALISNIMTDPDAFVEKENRRRNNRLARTLRKLSLAFRKRLLMKRKIVTVEVPTEVEKIVEVETVVEKIVEKTVREEVDKLVPEIVPIPIFVPNGGDPQAELDKVTGHYNALNKRVQETFEQTARKHEDYDKGD